MAAKITETKCAEVIKFYIDNPTSSIKDVANKTGVCVQTVTRILVRYGIVIDKGRSTRGHPALRLRGKTPWNKGKTKYTDSKIAGYAKTKSKQQSNIITGDGYAKVWSDELKKSVRVHHYEWFKNTGYWPDTSIGEQVHHIDGDKTNNEFSNLLLVDVTEHSAIHKAYELIVYELIKQGLVVFDKQSKTLDGSTLWKIINESKVSG